MTKSVTNLILLSLKQTLRNTTPEMLENKIRSLLKAYRAACRNSKNGYITATPSLIPFFGHLDALFGGRTKSRRYDKESLLEFPQPVSATKPTLHSLSVEAMSNGHQSYDESLDHNVMPASPNEIYIMEDHLISPAVSSSPPASQSSKRFEEAAVAADFPSDDDAPDEGHSNEPCNKCRCSAKLTMLLHAKKLECMRQIAADKEKGRNERFQAKMEGLKSIERNKDERAKRTNALKLQILASILDDKKRRHMERMQFT